MKSQSKLTITLIISGLLMFTSGTASAANFVGKITVAHLNGFIAGRDMCIQMLPAIPGTWACVYNTNPLRTQITTLLREAYELKKSCNVATSGLGSDGLPYIFAVECF